MFLIDYSLQCKNTYRGSISVGVVHTGIVTLIDPLPEDCTGHGLVRQQQAHYLYTQVQQFNSSNIKSN